MSFCHLRLIRIQNDPTLAGYSVESPDFDPAHVWAKIGTIKIHKIENNYVFMNEGEFLKHKIVPPWLYGLAKEEQERLLADQYKEHGCGAWAMRIHHYASSFIKDNNFPERYPLTYFNDKVQMSD